MIRSTWGSLFRLSALGVLLAGSAAFAIGLTSAGDGDLGNTVVLGIVLLGVPMAMLILLLGGLALIYSRPAQERGKRVRRITWCLAGALFTPMGLWLFLAAGGLGPLALIAASIGLGGLYALGRDILRDRQAPGVSV
jgi:hypothetical protein